eukprot:gene17887-24622_t
MSVIVARHAEREDCAWFLKGSNWQAQAERPWDTPLTLVGHRQGQALGQGVSEHLARLKLPAVSRIYCSPIMRCAQTAAAAASELGISELRVDPSLSETICEDWYRSWGVPGADSSWGGPKGLRTGTPVDPEALHAGCKGKASELHNSPARLQALLAGDPTTTGAGGSGGSVADSDGARVTFETSYVPQFTADAYTWGSFETEESLQKRMKGMVEYVSKAHPGETVLLVSHGGPTASCYDAVCPGGGFEGVCGYTGLYLYKRNEEKGAAWEALLTGDQAHLERVGEGTATSPSSDDEQGGGSGGKK